MSAEPPAEMSGSGTPSTGSTPSTTAMFTNAWPMIQIMMPPVAMRVKLSRAERMTRTNAMASTMNSASTTMAPMSPSSSPMIAKMKSLDASGSQFHFVSELPSPTPNTPPAASAHMPCCTCQHSPDASFSVQPLSHTMMRCERESLVNANMVPSTPSTRIVTARYRSLTPAKYRQPSTSAIMIVAVPRSLPMSTKPIATSATGPIGSATCFQSPSRCSLVESTHAIHTTSAIFTNSEGWKLNEPTSIQLRLPP